MMLHISQEHFQISLSKKVISVSVDCAESFFLNISIYIHSDFLSILCSSLTVFCIHSMQSNSTGVRDFKDGIQTTYVHTVSVRKPDVLNPGGHLSGFGTKTVQTSPKFGFQTHV